MEPAGVIGYGDGLMNCVAVCCRAVPCRGALLMSAELITLYTTCYLPANYSLLTRVATSLEFLDSVLH